ncbi:hypothetical protein KJ605_00130 [Patescibacteria group bacterium]|nr:hypothetical protein [Patescibacteria group bacterium]MBU1970178.1 hypothetical protein [Patescibacteria group bacterium]
MPAKINRNAGGYALLEILLAVAVASVIITAMVSLGIAMVRGVTANRSFSEAGKLSQREADRLKLLRDIATDWDDFKSKVSGCSDSAASQTDGCHLEVSGGSLVKRNGPTTDPSSRISYSFGISPVFPGPTITRVDYIVRAWWEVAGVQRNYVIEGAFTSWREE